MATARKFKVGDTIWGYSPGHRSSQRFQVIGIEGRSYLIALGGRTPVKVSFQKAEQEYRTDAEHADCVWVGENRHRIVERVRLVDIATLRRVAKVIGYEEAE